MTIPIVVTLATQRIEELSGKAKAIAAEIATLEANRPDAPHHEQIEAALAAIPDKRELLERAVKEGPVAPRRLRQTQRHGRGQHPCSAPASGPTPTKKSDGPRPSLNFGYSGGRIRTCDLRVMSPYLDLGRTAQS
jgi:hypothetical protein